MGSWFGICSPPFVQTSSWSPAFRLLTYYKITGRVLIDFHGYAKHHLGLQRLQKPSKNGESSDSSEGAYIKPLNAEEQRVNKASMLKRSKDLIFLSPMLSGFAMKDKLWRTFLGCQLLLHSYC